MFERAVKYKLQKKISEKQKVVKTNLYLVVNTPVRETRTSMLQLTPKLHAHTKKCDSLNQNADKPQKNDSQFPHK